MIIEHFGLGTVENLARGHDVVKTIKQKIINDGMKDSSALCSYSANNSVDMMARAVASAYRLTGMSDKPPMKPASPTVGNTATTYELRTDLSHGETDICQRHPK